MREHEKYNQSFAALPNIFLQIVIYAVHDGVSWSKSFINTHFG